MAEDPQKQQDSSTQPNDPGFGLKYHRKVKRTINKDGSFNVIKKGEDFSFRDAYLWLVNMSWLRFLLLMLTFYILINAFFASLYYFVGVEHLVGAEETTMSGDFLACFFFSVQTFTTVGYGGIAPIGLGANLIASLEAFFGLLGFGLTTGLLYGRFSKPSARIRFSKEAIIAPFKDGKALMFRIANQRRTTLLNMETRVLILFTHHDSKNFKRSFFPAELTFPRIYFFPLTWTLVHPINEDSPLYGKSMEELERLDMEVLVLIKGFDDTFSQEVNARYSYKCEEVVFGAKFLPTFEPDHEGNIQLDLRQIDAYKKVKLEQKAEKKKAKPAEEAKDPGQPGANK